MSIDPPSATVEQNSRDFSSLNSSFWNELCGTTFAKSLDITDHSASSIKRFDDWYFAFYPYLFIHIPFEDMRNKRVLEVGLGYGTVSQRIAEVGAQYVGLDIAEGPVWMANYRLKRASLPGKAHTGDILRSNLADDGFDFVIAIGCLHHTGDLQRAINECHRILRPGGRLVFMVYNAYSYRRFCQAKTEFAWYAFRELFGYRGIAEAKNSNERAAYDVNAAGDAAPHTDFVSARSLRYLCRKFSNVSITRENIDTGRPFENAASRRELLKTLWPRLCGLDLYTTAIK